MSPLMIVLTILVPLPPALLPLSHFPFLLFLTLRLLQFVSYYPCLLRLSPHRLLHISLLHHHLSHLLRFPHLLWRFLPALLLRSPLFRCTTLVAHVLLLPLSLLPRPCSVPLQPLLPSMIFMIVGLSGLLTVTALRPLLLLSL